MSSTGDTFRFKNTTQLKIKGWRKDIHANKN